MIQKIKNVVLIGMTSFAMLVPAVVAPIAVHADIKDNICTGSQAASGDTGTCGTTSGSLDSGLKGLATDVTRWFTIVVGAMSVIMIIYGGFRYITSGGDSGRVGSAKNTIIYALIGLIIVVLAQIIVNIVIKQSSSTSTTF